mgnify:CR=1 FL=1
METPKIFESEYRFCLLLWDHEPVNSTKLAALCKEQLGWSKATTYTVIRRLGERGVLKNENATVTALISREEAQTSRVEELVEMFRDFYGTPSQAKAYIGFDADKANEMLARLTSPPMPGSRPFPRATRRRFSWCWP